LRWLGVNGQAASTNLDLGRWSERLMMMPNSSSIAATKSIAVGLSISSFAGEGGDAADRAPG
jgi:hypothetical protein